MTRRRNPLGQTAHEANPLGQLGGRDNPLGPGPTTNPIPADAKPLPAPELLDYDEVGRAPTKKKRKVRSDKKPEASTKSQRSRLGGKDVNGNPRRHVQTKAIIRAMSIAFKDRSISFKDIHRATGVYSSECSRIFSRKSKSPTSPLCDTLATIAEYLGFELQLVKKA